MSAAFETAVEQRLGGLLASASDDQIAACRFHIQEAQRALADLDDGPNAAAFSQFLAQLDSMAAARSTGIRTNSVEDRDHDYGSFMKLCRSVRFHWGPWAQPSDSQAFSPHTWALSEVLAVTDVHAPWRVLEVGCGTGAFAHALMSARPSLCMTLFDPALESLLVATALLSGVPLRLPLRSPFTTASSGIAWFDVAVPDVGARCRWSLCPPKASDAPFDCVVAINAISLARDPRLAIVDCARSLTAGGYLVWIDLCSWRVETPRPRRIRGLAEMADLCAHAGLEVVKKVGGIPYIEDWGFERSYNWLDNLVVARRV